MLLERYVPESGLSLPDGRFVPAGTAVGINPYVAARNRGVWGDDADVWNPERYAALDKDGQVPVGVYENLLNFCAFACRLCLHFSDVVRSAAGIRGCIGWRFACVSTWRTSSTDTDDQVQGP